ncbi:MAG: hypothetical protein BGO98_45995 [Myxococcales bacterium 68-20]|nr:MAG: hypothetical protein BGO98_45995 [Myxococcales bacterium 68-20]
MTSPCSAASRANERPAMPLPITRKSHVKRMLPSTTAARAGVADPRARVASSRLDKVDETRPLDARGPRSRLRARHDAGRAVARCTLQPPSRAKRATFAMPRASAEVMRAPRVARGSWLACSNREARAPHV